VLKINEQGLSEFDRNRESDRIGKDPRLSDQEKQNPGSLWYKDAIIYEVHVKSFFDSNNDGIGDFPGLIEKLDYLQELGVTALWLLPFYPSPLLDDGYDISDYFNVHPDYGTLADFKRFLREAHRRGIRVITELVINHTSNQHPWFQRSRRAAPGSPWRDFYVWSDTAEKYRDARIIFTDSENSNWAWDPVAHAYYWHRFYRHQPDLNYDNPRVRREISHVLDFWFRMGVDGMRLDAVPYLFEREDTNCENLPETHVFLKQLRADLDRKFSDRMLLAEANQWPQDAAAYFGQGDECHMAFHFPIMPRLFMALRMEDRFPVIDMLEQSLNIPPNCQWGMFLRNHDELTLEMVTDEERDYMFNAYAQDPRARINVGIRRRLAPLLDNSRRRFELLKGLLFSLPGTPVLYYGDEIGMGDNYFLGDRNGVRTPMQWSPDRNAGFSDAESSRLYLPLVTDPAYRFEVVNVEDENRNLSSVLWFMRRLLAARKRFRAFGRGSIDFLISDNAKVLTFVRRYDDEILLVVANLSRYCQSVQIQMPAYRGFSVRDVFSDNRFQDVTEAPYTVTLGPHGFYWFVLTPPTGPSPQAPEQMPQVRCSVSWDRLISRNVCERLVEPLMEYVRRTRSSGGKARTPRVLHIVDHATFPGADHLIHLLLLEVLYTGAQRERYLLPLGFARGEAQARLLKESPDRAIARLQTKDEEGLLYDAARDESFGNALIEMIARKHGKAVGTGRLVPRRSNRFSTLLVGKTLPLPASPLQAGQRNAFIDYDHTLFLKLYGRGEDGVNPDVELLQQLAEQTTFANIPAFGGSVEWRREGSASTTVALLLGYVAHESDGWSYTLDNVERSFGYAQTLKSDARNWPHTPASMMHLDPAQVPGPVRDFIGTVYLDMVTLLGRRTAELHRALASLSGTPDLTAEPFSLLYQKSLFQSIRGMTLKVSSELEHSLNSLDAQTASAARNILAGKQTIISRLARITERKIRAMKMRIHGNYHLGQLLNTGKDFVIIDFEGEPTRSLTERRLKQSALRDVAGMIRSFHYAAHGAISLRSARQGADVSYLRPWADLWYRYVAGAFLHAYRQGVADAAFVPKDENEFAVLLDTFLLEKAIYEMDYELNNRPEWLTIPVRGVEYMLTTGL
jgi:maltose alpha-D-glucosyltransferase / alpha-amylase